ncbi:MAG: phosphonate ABC transporter ATP-binding protein [Methanosarcina sp.]
MLTVNNLAKKLPDGRYLLKDINFSVRKSEFVAILGLSGTGKTILLRCLNGLTMPDAGRVLHTHNEETLDIVYSNPKTIREIRKRTGMIFQNFNLVKRKSVIENVLMGKLGNMQTLGSILGKFTDEDLEMASRALYRVGVLNLAHRRAGTLSGGEQQRVAISRAIMQEPHLLLADEPVANLDPTTADSVMRYLRSISVEDGVSTLAVLHQPELARKYATRIIGVRGGVVVYDGDPKIPESSLKEIYGM